MTPERYQALLRWLEARPALKKLVIALGAAGCCYCCYCGAAGCLPCPLPATLCCWCC